MCNSASTHRPATELVTAEMRTTSLLVAEKFGKRHADVLRAIDALEIPAEYRDRNFALTFRGVPGPKGALRQERAFTMNRDGFSLLVMGFTGAAAMKWKLRFLEAFNLMEQALRHPEQHLGVTPPERGAEGFDLFGLPERAISNSLAMVREMRLLHGREAAAGLWNDLPLPKPRFSQEERFQDQGFDPIAAFLSECCTVTGNHADFVMARDLIDALWDWQDGQGEARLGARTASNLIRRQADRYRCPATGKRFHQGKSGVTGYRGLHLRSSAAWAAE